MSKLYFGEALALLAKTMPFLWIRLGSYALLGVALGVYFAVLGGLAWLLGSLWAPLGWIVFIVAIGGGYGGMRWASRYYFYLLKAAHTSVMTEFIVNGTGPQGSQVEYGRKQVTERFRDTSILFAVDQLVDGVVKSIVRNFTQISEALPIPGIDGLGKLLERVAIASTTFIDESILSRAYAKREQNVWSVARDGVVLYAQAWKPILTNAVALALLTYVQFFLILVILALPALALGAALPGMRFALAVGVLITAWMIKLAVADAFALAATLVAYHRATAGLEPDAQWIAKIEGVSEKFRELGHKAAEAVREGTASPAGPEPVAAPVSSPILITPEAEGNPSAS
ncbi:MAG: hypothetical protein WD273_01800 [Trueperaceae bacterium]